MNISKEVGERWYFELCETIVKLIKELGLKHLKKSNYFNAIFGVCCFFVVVVICCCLLLLSFFFLTGKSIFFMNA